MVTTMEAFKAGTKVEIVGNGTKLYPTYDSKDSKRFTTQQKYYIYDPSINNNRIRITKDQSAVGKPCMMSGWVSLKALKVVED